MCKQLFDNCNAESCMLKSFKKKDMLLLSEHTIIYSFSKGLCKLQKCTHECKS
jgi:hypothetical protein